MTYPTAALPFSSSVQFAGSGIQSQTAGPATLAINQQEYMHDIATMTFWGGNVDADSLTSGTPVLVTFGRPLVKRTFYGYVNHASRTNNALSTVSSLTDRNAVTVTCVGASWTMKQQGTRSWYNYTSSQIVQEVADLFGLAADIIPTSTVWASRQMAGRSYWRFCVELAKEIGYTFACNGVQLIFRPRQTNPSALQSLAALYDYGTDPYSVPVFTPVVGATSPQGGQLANRKLAGVNPRTNQVVFAEVSGDPGPTALGSKPVVPVFDIIEHCTVNSQEEANALTEGAGALNQLYITANATAVGNPLISQCSLVYLRNANGGQNGLWYVQKAAHTLDTKTYSTGMMLGRNSMGTSLNIAAVPQTASAPKASLVGGSWVAQ